MWPLMERKFYLRLLLLRIVYLKLRNYTSPTTTTRNPVFKRTRFNPSLRMKMSSQGIEQVALGIDVSYICKQCSLPEKSCPFFVLIQLRTQPNTPLNKHTCRSDLSLEVTDISNTFIPPLLLLLHAQYCPMYQYDK